MPRIEIQLDAGALERARHLALERGCTVEQLLREQLSQMNASGTTSRPKRDESSPDSFWGLFGDAVDLVDEILAETLRDRQQRQLRNADV